MPQNPFPYVKTVVVDHTPGVPGSGTDALAAHHNKQGDAAAYLANAIPLFKVDPNDTENCFATLALAWAAADIALAAGAKARFLLADGTYSDNVDFGTDHPIILESINYRGAKITGNLTFGNYAALTRHQINECEINTSIITIKDGTYLKLRECSMPSFQIKYDPSGGSVGITAELINCRTQMIEWSGNSSIVETAAPTGDDILIIRNGELVVLAITVPAFNVYQLKTYIQNCSTKEGGESHVISSFADSNNDVTGAQFFFEETSIGNGSAGADWFANVGGMTVNFKSTTIVCASTKSLDLGSAISASGDLRVIGDTAPTDKFPNMIWHDTGTWTIKVWTGAAWL